ncbi:mediator of RNA polymerase II transcription subunit 17 [Anopheles aquasalis]|uniref:mediator of RNA polymerase II transcription subunit 17 n=1 Tax=Anopheles albimanus TaxID=7167 RepID=UPI00163FD910|nr:mediator of RNA polymerase II transcription subunit 17 [Anopheles albimanus]XP_050084707.1 mediator of RNA polymerase II transcription subunit 17 [Anopheles aquasalis]
MSLSANISVEAPIENQIQEISYDGTETYQLPPTLSEHLAKCAAKIDFSKTSSDIDLLQQSIKKEDEKKEEESKDPKEQFQSSLWPWDSVRNKLKEALTEVCVLSDVLHIAKEKRFMVLDPIPQEPPEVKPMVLVYARKKALASAANILQSGVERLKAAQSDQGVNRSNSTDFHIELLRLRRNWRLKKVSNTIIGDLSYRTAGSKFMHPGMFEVTKAEDEESGSPPASPSGAGAAGTVACPKINSALRVNVPTELQGVAFIKVITQKDQEDLCTATLNMMGSTQLVPQAGAWQQTLEYAQNVLFCKELFNQLAREAVQLQAPIPHVVVGNQIRATLLPGIQLIISLCHSTSSDSNNSSEPIKDHDHVLEHSLHQLLREFHHKNTHHPFPHPASGPLGPSKKRMLAGPSAFDRHELLEMTKSQTLLEQIIAQAQHIFTRRRTQYVLDTLARDVKDPLITSHWNAMNSPTMSCVKINITSHGYDANLRTSLVIHVKERSLKCICRDGRIMHMSYEPQELRDLILCQISQHQIVCLQNLAKCMAWQILSSSSHLGIGAVEPLGNASSCVLASPNSDRLIAVQVRCDSQIDVKVYIAQSPAKDFFPGSLVQGRHWEHLGGHFKEVRFDKMEGKNFHNKMEFLMASLTSQS